VVLGALLGIVLGGGELGEGRAAAAKRSTTVIEKAISVRALLQTPAQRLVERT
jgi:hypothetical protein